MLLFGLLGMLGMQYTYFASIESGNAAIVTLLQYLAPLFILLYTVLWTRTKLVPLDIIGALLALGSLRHIAPHEASLLSCTEPISAIVSSVIWLSVPFNLFQALGAGMVVLMTVMVSLKSRIGTA